MRDMADFVDQHDAAFVLYYDMLWDGTTDFRLLDSPSIRAWKDISGD